MNGATAGAGEPDLVARTAVVETFDLSFFADQADVTAVVTFLQDSCRRVESPSGRSAWSLTDHTRRRCFGSVPRKNCSAYGAYASL